MNVPTKIIVHHDGVSRDRPSFGIVNTYHRDIGFPVSSLGYYCGYHYWIERDGTLIQAREEHEIGAHCIRHNSSSIGIGLAGNFDIELPTDGQVDTLGQLLVAICDRYQLASAAIVPHRNYAHKTCYGARLSDKWAAGVNLRARMAQLNAQIAAYEERHEK